MLKPCHLPSKWNMFAHAYCMLDAILLVVYRHRIRTQNSRNLSNDELTLSFTHSLHAHSSSNNSNSDCQMDTVRQYVWPCLQIVWLAFCFLSKFIWNFYCLLCFSIIGFGKESKKEIATTFFEMNVLGLRLKFICKTWLNWAHFGHVFKGFSRCFEAIGWFFFLLFGQRPQNTIITNLMHISHFEAQVLARNITTTCVSKTASMSGVLLVWRMQKRSNKVEHTSHT